MRVVGVLADASHMEDRSFPAVLRRFDRHLDVISRSDATRRQYRYELLRWWTDYLFDAELEVADVRPAHVEEYLGGLPRQGSKRTDAIRALRALFAWAVVEGEVADTVNAKAPPDRPGRATVEGRWADAEASAFYGPRVFESRDATKVTAQPMIAETAATTPG